MNALFYYKVFAIGITGLWGFYFILSFILAAFVAHKIDTIRQIVSQVSGTVFRQENGNSGVYGWIRFRQTFEALGFNVKKGRPYSWYTIKSKVFQGVDIDKLNNATLQSHIIHLKMGYFIYSTISTIWIVGSVFIVGYTLYGFVRLFF